MNKRDDEKEFGTRQSTDVEKGRRDFLKGSAAAAGAGLAATAVPGVSGAAEGDCQPENPYGARPGGGISLPEYYKPWPAIKNRNMYLPGTEILPKNEMRITFLGSSPWPPNRLQKGTSMLVELGNGTRSRGVSSSIWAMAASAMRSRCKCLHRSSTTSSSAISTRITMPTCPTCIPSAPFRAASRLCGCTDPREERPSWGPRPWSRTCGR